MELSELQDKVSNSADKLEFIVDILAKRTPEEDTIMVDGLVLILGDILNELRKISGEKEKKN